jgi:hypothetical protein
MKIDDGLGYIVTGSAFALTIADINNILTTAVLIASLLFWLRKHWNFNRKRDQ